MEIKKVTIDNYTINYYSNDTVIGKHLENGKLWGSEIKTIYKEYYRPNSNILDIGGFIGTVSLVLSEVIDKNKKIYVFEPQYYDCLIQNIKDNNLGDIIIPYKYGLSNINGFIPSNNIDLTIEGNYGGKCLTTLYDKSLDTYTVPKDSNTIELKKLDDFGFNEIGLIKLDVEGFELLVLQGGVETIKKNNFPPILIEIWDAECWRNQENTRDFYIQNKKDIINFLLDLNYKIKWNQAHDYVFIHE
jgi:FkbM family methyltransferase